MGIVQIVHGESSGSAVYLDSKVMSLAMRWLAHNYDAPTAGDSISTFSAVVEPPRVNDRLPSRRASTATAASSLEKGSPGKFAASVDPAELERRVDALERARDERGAQQQLEKLAAKGEAPNTPLCAYSTRTQ